ncbi:MAG TPA: 23S rRNA (pseudouridine(1915)-N(3))-methyltransferase RlmH [Candidatus Saccharimonadales bacterium]|nr:23S rRNA (pseudouridine(1915)-N(3))-methyltransferase RlmH [Candidatus Saccharimonadales bacterium]
MVIKLIAIGPKHDPQLKDKMAGFVKRLPYSVDWQLLPYSKADGDVARQSESTQILSKVSERDLCILLDETGSQLTSEALAGKLSSWLSYGRPLVFVIGGAYGVDQRLKDRADFIWSLSQLVFPHQLVRLMLVEQLYRASTIASGHPYHHK